MKAKVFVVVNLVAILAFAVTGPATAQRSQPPRQTELVEGFPSLFPLPLALSTAKSQGITESNEFTGQIRYTGIYAVAVQGQYAYVVDGQLHVINISNLTAPSEVGYCNTPGSAIGVAVSGTYAYVADGEAGLRIVDVSRPARPHEAGFYDTPGNAMGVAVSGGYAYVADGDAGLRIVSVSNPASPYEAGFYDTPGNARGVAVSGRYAYVADGDAGLRIVDVSNPAAPSEVGFYDTPGLAWGVAVSEAYAFVADHWAGLRIIDISNPATPYEATFYDTSPNLAYSVAVNATYVYVAYYGDVVVLHFLDRGGVTPMFTPFPKPIGCECYLECIDCLASRYICGWCRSTGKCLHGNSAGPFDGSCTDYNWIWGSFENCVGTPPPLTLGPITPVPQTPTATPRDYAKVGEVVGDPIEVRHPGGEGRSVPKTFRIYPFFKGEKLTGLLVWDPASNVPVADRQPVTDIITLYLGYRLFEDEAQGIIEYYKVRGNQSRDLFDLSNKRYGIGIALGGTTKLYETFISVLTSLSIPGRGAATLSDFADYILFFARRLEEIVGVSTIGNFQDILAMSDWLEQQRVRWELVGNVKAGLEAIMTLEDAFDTLARIGQASPRATKAILQHASKKFAGKIHVEFVDLTFDGGLDSALQMDIMIMTTCMGEIIVSQNAQGHAERIARHQAWPGDITGLLEDEMMDARLPAARFDFMWQAESRIVEKSPLLAWLMGIDLPAIEAHRLAADRYRQEALDAQLEALTFELLVERAVGDHLHRIEHSEP